ncbi:hypothetical protein ABZ135_28610 [Streptomyces sp. NPDC006339]|uniref:hypothetical protein n=1 Tax=Streptomyces sp. NPDC006339 TaxID=3156755 RepID=UPI0033A04C13
MPTYQEIMQTDLGKLNTAADGWKSMAEKLKKVEDLYEREVQSVATKNPLWTGQAQQFSAQNFQITRNELDAAQKEALAMESLLRDAHGTFTELKGRVKAAVDEAIAAGMKVSESGNASYDFSKVSEKEAYAIRHDPDLREVEMSYTRKINDAVKAVTDFDADVKVALLNASGADGTAPLGFNSKPVNDVQAVEALALSEKVREGKASKEELEHYRDLLKQNSDDKHFSEAYLNALGAKDTLAIADKMNLAANERGIPADQKKLYESIQAGLADTIASGTKDPNSYAYRPFVDGLKELGNKHVDDAGIHDNVPTQGYQVLVTLMSQGNADGYGKEFLNEIGHDMIELEKKDPNQWQHFRDVLRPNIAADPLDGLLNIMSKDPADAEYFLDPKAPGNNNDHLKFLLTEREWPKMGMNNIYGPPMTMDDPFKATGLGNAIQAAATGQEPGSKPGEVGAHTEGQARVMHDTILLLDKDKNGDEFPEDLKNLQKPIAHALADYVGDTHIILNGDNADYGGSKGKGEGEILGSGDNSHIAVGQGSLVRVMRGVAEDSEAFALLYESERAFSAKELAEAPAYEGDKVHGQSSDWDHRAKQVGGALGALNGIGADVYIDKEDDKVKWAESTAEYSANGVNSILGEIPIAGSAASAIVDTAKYEWVKDVTDAAEEEGKKDSSDNYSAGKDGTNDLLNAWGEKKGITKSGAYNSAKDAANGGYEDGRGSAAQHLGN